MKKRILIMLLLFALTLGLTSCLDFLPTGNPSGGGDGGGLSKDEVASLESISLLGAKKNFAFGEEFSSDGIVVTATMSDGKKKLLGSGDYTVICEDYNPMKVGKYQVRVSVNGTNVSESYEVNLAPANKLKVLMIGNSFADDTINYAHEIAKSAGIPEENILIADVYIGGCPLDTHWLNILNNYPAYRFGLEREGWFDGSSYTEWTMDEAIMYADWDYITLQQNSGNSGKPETYRNLQKIMDYVLDLATDQVNNPNANPNVKLVWHQTWAYTNGSTNSGFPAYNKNQMTMYNAIQSALQQCVLDKDFAAIIPNGTAIQNARTSFIGDNLTRDQYDHLSHDAGRYIAALSMVCTLTGRDPSSITWKPTDSGFNYPMSDEMITVCKESVVNAMQYPYQISQSAYPVGSVASQFE